MSTYEYDTVTENAGREVLAGVECEECGTWEDVIFETYGIGQMIGYCSAGHEIDIEEI